MEECIICFEETNKFIIFNCYHKVCVNCYPKINQCPLCRIIINSQTENTLQIEIIEQIEITPQIRHLNINDKCCILILVSFVIILLCITIKKIYSIT